MLTPDGPVPVGLPFSGPPSSASIPGSSDDPYFGAGQDSLEGQLAAAGGICQRKKKEFTSWADATAAAPRWG